MMAYYYLGGILLLVFGMIVVRYTVSLSPHGAWFLGTVIGGVTSITIGVGLVLWALCRGHTMAKRKLVVKNPAWADEMCSCGHTRGNHEHELEGLSLGSGKCRLCSCDFRRGKFTWVPTDKVTDRVH